MTPNKAAQRESTLLAVIAQLQARGATFEDVAEYVQELKNPSSKVLVDRLFGRDDGNGGPSTLAKWAEALTP